MKRVFKSISKVCLECNNGFIAHKQSTKFCSAKCNNLSLYKSRDVEAYNARKRSKSVAEQRRVRYHTDPQFRLANIIRARMTSAIKNKHKVGSAIEALGCSINELTTYLEDQFEPGMSWDNHGRFGWHIDHIKPLCKFDLTDIEQFKEACHHTNLQPMWWRPNIVKGGK